MSFTGRVRFLLIGAIGLVLAASRGDLVSAGVPAADTPQVVSLSVAGRANATPSIAAQGQFVAVAFGASLPAGATDVYLAVSRDGGRVFGSPVRVNDVAGDAKLSGEQPPHVALVTRAGQDPRVVIVWTAKGQSGTRLLTARSDDGGATFSRAAAVSGGDAAGNRGWESIATDRNGDVVAIWLDHRETATGAAAPAPMNHEGMNHAAAPATKADSVARAQLSKLYVGRVSGPAATHAIVGGVCYCCKTTVDIGPDGAIYTAWRHVYPGNVRDIAFTSSKDGGRTFAAPTRVSEDRWVLDGCPENGPSLAVDARSRVHIVWPTLVDGTKPGDEPTLALFYAESAGGQGFSKRERIPTEGTPRHPQLVVAPDHTSLLAWDEGADGARRVVLARRADGRPAEGRPALTRVVVSDKDEAATYPVVVPVGSTAVLAWTSGSSERSAIRVKRIDPAASAVSVARR